MPKQGSVVIFMKAKKAILYDPLAGLTKKFEPVLLESYPSLEVVQKADAKGDYKESLIIDLSGNNSSQITQLATALKLKLNLLPKEETKPQNADILIILGEDKANP